MPTFYVTKHALTNGIKEMDAASFSQGDKRVYGKLTPDDYIAQGFDIGAEAFTTRDEALVNAEQRRLRKIDSLKRQIAKLEKLTF